MSRRLLLGSAAALPAGLTASSLFAATRSGRVRPGDPDWPSEAVWKSLSDSLEGQLTRPKPFLASCLAAPDSKVCRTDLSLANNPFYLGDQSGGTQVSGWYKAWTPKPSAYAVACQSAADVAKAVDFARRHNLRLAVKGGGHSYQGTSSAPDSLLVWQRKRNRVILHDEFVPAGMEGRSGPEKAVSVEAGAMWIDVYDAVVTRAGRYVQGGGCTTVGVAGLVSSGGYGSFSKGFGSASSNLLEAEIVTADGKIRVVNAAQDPDLFWALKGGGGGSFGVITRLTLRTFDLPQSFGSANMSIRAADDAAYLALIEQFFGFYKAHLFNPRWGEQVSVRPDNILKISMTAQDADTAEVEADWMPFITWVKARPEAYSFESGPFLGAMPAQHWWDGPYRKSHGDNALVFDARPGAKPVHAWWDGDGEQAGAFLHAFDSLWLDQGLLSDARRGALSDALFTASRAFAVGLHFNKGLAGAPEDRRKAALDTATHPASVDAFALAIVAAAGRSQFKGLPGRSDDLTAEGNARQVQEAMRRLSTVSAIKGSYVSESNYFNPDWRTAFWGENYARLLAVKARYDPDDLFIVRHGVGSENWSDDGFRRL